ncbi:hypothetical protein RCG23_24865 [Neobacillus sp. PS3-34]|uniref:hypothetical protein n=1 Tax=Neobacillus sp. PS3-34 TaxID=3070678 RepID=UPI0027DFCD02|nr:hypothetical protein [Neobacillus sp. PS3-34]WML48430.1 hypothetical protein RCG23_24865 [Neobacillus sp. PS3-34]
MKKYHRTMLGLMASSFAAFFVVFFFNNLPGVVVAPSIFSVENTLFFIFLFLSLFYVLSLKVVSLRTERKEKKENKQYRQSKLGDWDY